MASRFFCVNNDGLHIFTEKLGYGDVVALMDGMTHVDDSVVDTFVEPLEIFHNLLLLASTRVFVLVHAGFAEILGDIVQFVLFETISDVKQDSLVITLKALTRLCNTSAFLSNHRNKQSM